MTATMNAPCSKQAALERFDQLRSNSRLFYGATIPESIIDNGFTFQFTLVKAFTQKPWEGKSSTVAKPDPFGQPEEDFIISSTSSHLLQLNKFNAWRPQFIIHPRQYASQKEPLTFQDFEATSHFLSQLEGDGSRWLTFYNCCPESGSSQPYKHLQIVEKPTRRDFVLWPDSEPMQDQFRSTTNGIPMVSPQSANVPYVCALASLEQAKGAQTLYTIYQSLLSTLEKTIDQPVTAHNMMMTFDWLLIVPRRQAGSPCAANSMGMLGIVWVCSEEEKQGWKERGYTRHLQQLAYPVTATG